jgi:Arc/MetJ family transcription regulator
VTGNHDEPDQTNMVYHWCMSRTNIDIDDEACEAVMERFHLRSKRDAVNFALRRLATEPLSVDRARQVRGTGWEGDLDELRGARTQ